MGRGRPKGVKNAPKPVSTINWEKLAKDLQAALAKEIKENQDLYKTVASKETFIVQQAAIIQYLETKVWTLFNSKA